MNCSRFRSRLHSLVEERSSLRVVEDDLRDHLANCGDSACREAWYELCLLDQAIGDWVVEFPAPDLGERVVLELQSTLDKSSPGASVDTAAVELRPVGGSHHPVSGEAVHRRTLRWVVVSMALIALVSLIAIVTSSQPAGDGLVDPGSVAGDLTREPDVASPSFDSPTAPFSSTERNSADAELSNAYLGIAEGATQFLTDTVVLTLAGEEDIENPTAAAELIHQVRVRVGPWGDEFDAALDRFLGTLPDSEPS